MLSSSDGVFGKLSITEDLMFCGSMPYGMPPFSTRYAVNQNFMALLKQSYGPPKHPETFRSQVTVEILPGIPFLNNAEFVFIFQTPVNVAIPASLFGPHRTGQRLYRLGKLLALLCTSFHAYDDENHAKSNCKWPANNRQYPRCWIPALITGNYISVGFPWRRKG